MKKIAFGFVFLLSLFGIVSCGKKQNEVDSRPVIKIACAQDEGIISFVDEEGNLTGEEVEIWREIIKLIPDYNIKLIATSQDDVRVGLQTGNYDGSVADFFLTKERIENFYIPLEPLDFTWTGMLIRKEFAEGINGLSDIATKQYTEGLTIAPQTTGTGSTYILDVYNEKNPDNKLNFDVSSEHMWTVSQSYVGIGRYGATCAQKTDYLTNFVSKDGAYHEYVDAVTWVPTENVGAYTLFNKNVSKDFTEKYVAALKTLKDNGTASKISEKFYGYDAYSNEPYHDFVETN